MVSLDTPLAQFPTVKKTILKKLHSLDLFKARDLLYYFPFRYDDFSKIVEIKNLEPDISLTVHGRLQLLSNRRSFVQRKMMTEGIVADNTGQIKAVRFNQPYLIKNLKVGDKIFLAGKVELSKYGWQLVNPTYEKERKDGSTLNTGRLVPVYPTTSGLSQKQIRFLIKTALGVANFLPDWLPEKLSTQFNFLSLALSLREVHFPTTNTKFVQAKNRFQFEELFLIQLSNEIWRRDLFKTNASKIKFQEETTRAFVDHLPFKLTTDQRAAAWEILLDLEKKRPMNRLLDGDVGSGKTVVAAMAVLNCVINGTQAALMAPTEILAAQHYETLSFLFKDFSIKIALLTSHQSKSIETENKKEILEKIGSGQVELVIGTHALVEKKIKFKKLGLAIVDEQHRFGVEQRHKLQQKGKGSKMPHFLSMTATPIPRSYALSLYGDLDLSLIKHKPLGRKIIITKLVEELNRSKAYDFIRNQIKAGRQAFVICPLIEEKEKSDKKSVLAEYKKLSEEIFPDLRIIFLHGRMPAADKEEVMKKFLARDFDILVSTSVVEVGVDVPNASVMMIEGADKFGLAQLHQFRGRVGRADHQSYCFLFTDSQSQNVYERLEFLSREADGFKIAEYDLQLRGAGNMYGKEQHGILEFKIASFQDYKLIELTQTLARDIIEKDPRLGSYPTIKKKLEEEGGAVHLE